MEYPWTRGTKGQHKSVAIIDGRGVMHDEERYGELGWKPADEIPFAFTSRNAWMLSLTANETSQPALPQPRICLYTHLRLGLFSATYTRVGLNQFLRRLDTRYGSWFEGDWFRPQLGFHLFFNMARGFICAKSGHFLFHIVNAELCYIGVNDSVRCLLFGT